MNFEKGTTGAYLTGVQHISSVPQMPKKLWNLLIQTNEIHVEIPLRVVVALTGVSGIGKSQLLFQDLYPALIILQAKIYQTLLIL